MRAQRITDPGKQKIFTLAGNAVLTLVSPSGTRFTYRVQAGDPEKRPIWFVSLLTGPDNTKDYEYVGFIGEDDGWRRGEKSRIQAAAPSVMGFSWAWDHIAAGRPLTGRGGEVEFWHEGRCGRCRRPLTVPDSIAAGLGPECQSKVLGT